MNKREAQVFTAYTGLLFGKFEWFHEYAEEMLGGPVWTHELMFPEMWAKLKSLAEPEFLQINHNAIEKESDE